MESIKKGPIGTNPKFVCDSYCFIVQQRMLENMDLITQTREDAEVVRGPRKCVGLGWAGFAVEIGTGECRYL